MPIPKYDGTPEKEWISSCMHEIGTEYDQDQALAICYNQMDIEMSLETLAKIPVEIIGDNEEKILEYLPSVKSHEEEDPYLNRCVPVLYPEYYDQTVATALCADKYQKVITVSDRRRTETQLKNLNIMKAKPMSDFDRNKLDFLVRFTEAKLRGEGILLADYPWDECIADQVARYGDQATAEAVCGKIKAESGSGTQTEKRK